MSRFKTGVLSSKQPLRIGFLPTTDSAPLIYAREAGLFDQRELSVDLVREASFAALGEKVVAGDLDLALAPAPVPFLTNLGVDDDASACVSPMVVSLQGSGIVLSRRLWSEGVTDAPRLLDYIGRHWGKRTVTLAVPSLFSTQAFLLEIWLSGGGIDSRTQVRVITVPSEQMYATLKLGYVDAFCAPEPWNSVAVQAGQGVCVATSPELSPLHPESVLITRRSFAAGRAGEVECVVAALLEACSACDQPTVRARVADMLAHPQWVNAPRESLAADLVGPFAPGHTGSIKPPLHLFHRYLANQPGENRASWVIDHLYAAINAQAAKRRTTQKPPILRNVFRRDIFERAEAMARRETDLLSEAPPVPAHSF